MNFSGYTTLDLVLERLNTIKIPGAEWNIGEVKEWVYEGLSKIGVVQEFIETTLPVEIQDGKGEIPSQIHTIHSIVEGEGGYNMQQINSFDSFRELTYKKNAGYIFTDFETGSVLINCSIFPLDEDNRPLIPDNEYYISAIYSFIRLKLGERLFWQNKIVGNQFQYLEREWNFYCPAAKNSSKMITEDKAANFQREFLKPMPNFYRNNRRKTTINLNIGSKPR